MTQSMELRYQDDAVSLTSVVTGPLDNNVYVITCRASGESAMVDAPGGNPALLAELCRAHDVRRLLLTHSHWDHIGALSRLSEFGLVPMIGSGDESALEAPAEVVDSEREIEIGSVTARLLLTPGHTPGSMCVALSKRPVVLTGDTLFPGGPGGTGRPGSDFPTIMRSVRRLCSELSAETIVFPGHGTDTTIGTETPQLDEWQRRGW